MLNPRTGPVHIDEGIYNPSHVQNVVVEHIIGNEPTHTTLAYTKIRTFSGWRPRPNGEVDYEAWCTQVDLLLSDYSLTDAHKVRKILESLLSPASEPLGVTALPSAYFTQLGSAFGGVVDGEELFTAFLGSNQSSGEKPSAFLSRLHSLLTRAMSRGGASASDVKEHKQFIRDCWDQSLIIGLQLEGKKGSPPSFPDLLLMLRTEQISIMKPVLNVDANIKLIFILPVKSLDTLNVLLPLTKILLSWTWRPKANSFSC